MILESSNPSCFTSGNLLSSIAINPFLVVYLLFFIVMYMKLIFRHRIQFQVERMNDPAAAAAADDDVQVGR